MPLVPWHRPETADPGDLPTAGDVTLSAAVDATPKIIRSINKSPALLCIPEPTDAQSSRAKVISNAPDAEWRTADKALHTLA